MQRYKLTTIETVLAKFSRDLRGTEFVESDIIEWTGEALSYLKIPTLQEEAVAFIEVKEHKAELPCNFLSVIQIAKRMYSDNLGQRDTPERIGKELHLWDKDCPHCKEEKRIPYNQFEGYNPNLNIDSNAEFALTEPNTYEEVFKDCDNHPIPTFQYADLTRYFTAKYGYYDWIASSTYKNGYIPVRLANHSFFHTIVCREKDESPYMNNYEEYTIAGTFPNYDLWFSFKEGQVALAYIRASIDSKTGYPLIPDDPKILIAIGYYIRWKIAERMMWDGREGFASQVQYAEQRWLKYIRQAINEAKMPKTIDEYQNLLEQSLYKMPRVHKYYGFFGNRSTFSLEGNYGRGY